MRYVECDPRGVDAEPELCQRIGVKGYPTWIVRGQRYEGVMSLGELAQASGFAGSAPR